MHTSFDSSTLFMTHEGSNFLSKILKNHLSTVMILIQNDMSTKLSKPLKSLSYYTIGQRKKDFVVIDEDKYDLQPCHVCFIGVAHRSNSSIKSIPIMLISQIILTIGLMYVEKHITLIENQN